MMHLKHHVSLKKLIIPTIFTLLLGAVFGSAKSDAQVITRRNANQAIANTQAPYSSNKALALQPATDDDPTAIEKSRNLVLNAVSLVDCANPTAPIAFSVLGFNNISSGQDSVLAYGPSSTSGIIITNEGPSWVAPTTFVAPCNGLYFFAISFIKDAFAFGGTEDDVNVYLTRTDLGNTTLAIPGSAWSGEGSGKRSTGAYSVAIRLIRGDVIRSWVHSDGNPTRHLSNFSLTGFRIAP